MKINEMYICEDCVVIFQLHSPVKKWKRPFCPYCGENTDTHAYIAERNSKSKVKIRWSVEELELVRKCQTGELAPHQVAIMIGRSINAVAKKLSRLDS